MDKHTLKLAAAYNMEAMKAHPNYKSVWQSIGGAAGLLLLAAVGMWFSNTFHIGTLGFLAFAIILVALGHVVDTFFKVRRAAEREAIRNREEFYKNVIQPAVKDDPDFAYFHAPECATLLETGTSRWYAPLGNSEHFTECCVSIKEDNLIVNTRDE